MRFGGGHATREANLLGLVPLLRIESVRQELQLDGEQTTVIEDLSISLREDFKEDLQSLLAQRKTTPRPKDRHDRR